MGLTICKKLVELHNGEIGFNSENNLTTFWFTIESKFNYEKIFVESDMDIVLKNKKILIVDDNLNNLELLALLLSKYDNICHTTNNGQKCIDILNDENHENVYDLILLDNNMPGLSGKQTSEIIKLTHDIKIIMISGDQDLISSRNIKSIDGFISKPVNINKLNNEFKKLL